MPTDFAAKLLTKLTASTILDDDDTRAIQDLSIRSRELGPNKVIVAEGDRPRECCLIGEGFAFRSKTTFDGQRQVLSLHIPGEIPDLQSIHLKVMDHDLVTLTPCTLGYISHEEMRALTRRRPNVAAALWRETLIDAAIFREWVVNLGRRSATTRMLHLLAELYYRLKAIGQARDNVRVSDHADPAGGLPRVVDRPRQQGSAGIAQTGPRQGQPVGVPASQAG